MRVTLFGQPAFPRTASHLREMKAGMLRCMHIGWQCDECLNAADVRSHFFRIRAAWFTPHIGRYQ